MARLTILACFSLAIVFNCVECSTNTLSTNVDVNLIQNPTDYLRENANVQILEPLVKNSLEADTSIDVTLIYKIGSRIDGKSCHREN